MSDTSTPIRIGTRSSKLALRQAALVQAALCRLDPSLTATGRIEIVAMQSAGDWRPEQQERSFAAMGSNKGLFAKELETALQERRIDCAVHSAKDLETTLADGLQLTGFMPRDDVRDVFISTHAAHPRDLPAGARIGTSSLRRAVQILHMRPDLVIAPFRGNVDTRLRKLQEGQVEATLLAQCGLDRLRLTGTLFHPLSVDDMLPAVAQGALAIETRVETGILHDLIRELNCSTTEECVTLERVFLHHLNGSCRTPVAALATRNSDGSFAFTALVAATDGSQLTRRQLTLPAALESARASLAALGGELRGILPAATVQH